MAKKPLRTIDLPLTRANAESPIPLYHQIEDDLRRLIDRGVLVLGDVLPPEVELCKGYGVGRQTMRTALNRLAADHLIVRKAGRGTVVQAPVRRAQFYLDRSFTSQMADMGLTAWSKVLRASTGVIEANAPRPLLVGSPCFYLDRLRFGGDEPVGLQYATIITGLCPGLEHHDFRHRSLYDVLSEEYSLDITEITHTIGAAVADSMRAGLLCVTVGSPLLTVKTCAYVADRRIIELTQSYYRADKYEYYTTHTSTI